MINPFGANIRTLVADKRASPFDIFLQIEPHAANLLTGQLQQALIVLSLSFLPLLLVVNASLYLRL